MPKNRRFAFVLNPQAGRGRARRVEDRLVRFLKSHSVNFTLERTKEPLHATRIAAQASNDYDVVVAVGGDGTVNEVANGVAGTNASMGILPAGSGNDFNKIVGVPSTLDAAIESLVHGVRKVFDIGHLHYQDSGDGAEHQRHFMNSFGVGLDATVADYTRRIRWLRGVPLYLTAVARSLYRFQRPELDVTMDGWTGKQKAFLLCAGNGMFEGGGFQLTPGADPHDALLEVCIIQDMPILKALPLIPKVLAGSHAEHSAVILRDTAEVTVRGEHPFALHVDGEVLGRSISVVRAGVKAGGVSVLVPPPPK